MLRTVALMMLVGAVVGFGCSSSQSTSQTADDETGDQVVTDSGSREDDVVEEDRSYLDLPACQSLNNSDMDPLQRWIGAFPIERSGTVMVFGGATAQQMDVEAALEMAAIMGYEDFTCGTSVVVWIPGMECHGDEVALANQVQEGSDMDHIETECFRIDEVRIRLQEECERGTVPADRCP